MTIVNDGPGYSEKDIEELLQDRRFLAAVHNYALDQLTLGQAMILAAPNAPVFPPKFKLNWPGYEQLIHEIARRIVTGRVVVPKSLRDEFSDIYAGPIVDTRARFRSGAPVYKFSGLETMPPDANPLTPRRKAFDEDDIKELMKDPCFLACIDSYRQGIITLYDVRARLFGDASHLPRGLSHEGFLRLAFEIINRIQDGRISLPPTLRDDCAFAYAPGSNNECDPSLTYHDRDGDGEMSNYLVVDAFIAPFAAASVGPVGDRGGLRAPDVNFFPARAGARGST